MHKNLIKKAFPHIVAVVVFLIISFAYFSPQLSGYTLRQGDSDQFMGMSKEIRDFREMENEEPLWTGAMFSGMPAYQISFYQTSNYVKTIEDFVVFKIIILNILNLF